VPWWLHEFCSLLVYSFRTASQERVHDREKRERGFYGFYNRLVGRAINTWAVLAGSFVFLLIGGFAASHLKYSFFRKMSNIVLPRHLLPNDVPLSANNDTQ